MEVAFTLIKGVSVTFFLSLIAICRIIKVSIDKNNQLDKVDFDNKFFLEFKQN